MKIDTYQLGGVWGAGIAVKVVRWDETKKREIGGFWRPSEVDILKGSVWGLPVSAHVLLPPPYFTIHIPYTQTSHSTKTITNISTFISTILGHT